MRHIILFETELAYDAAKDNFAYPTISYVRGSDEVKWMEPPYDPYNNHAYVDLGLPSGTKWATMNIGASNETDFGLYFGWAETTGYDIESDGDGGYELVERKSFYWDQYPYARYNSRLGTYEITKYNGTDLKTVLDSTDDAASVIWGGEWMMPTAANLEELLNEQYVTRTSVSNYNNSGVSGFLFTSVADSTKTMFLPYSGYISNNIVYVYDDDEWGYIWTRTLGSKGYNSGKTLFYDVKTGGDVSEDLRYVGLPIRPVVSPRISS